MNDAAPLIELHHVSHSYGHVPALRDASLRLAPGVIGLVGNNGAGKSTLMKVLMGLIRPRQGCGHVLGCDLQKLGREIRGRMGYMPESAALVPVLRGVEYVALSGDLYGMPHRDARRRAHEVLGYVGLGELRYRRVEEYSTGNLQRLKLAAALVHDPQLLLLDEPTGGLDPKGRESMLRLIADLIRETGKSVVFCTHLLRDVERLCHQVVFLHAGRVLHHGPLNDLRRRVPERYRLRFSGSSQALVEQLTAAGAEVHAETHGLAEISVPQGWTTLDLFRHAQAAGVTLTELQPDEEDLQRVFLRMTRDIPAASENTRGD